MGEGVALTEAEERALIARCQKTGESLDDAYRKARKRSDISTERWSERPM